MPMKDEEESKLSALAAVLGLEMSDGLLPSALRSALRDAKGDLNAAANLFLERKAVTTKRPLPPQSPQASKGTAKGSMTPKKKKPRPLSVQGSGRQTKLSSFFQRGLEGTPFDDLSKTAGIFNENVKGGGEMSKETASTTAAERSHCEPIATNSTRTAETPVIVPTDRSTSTTVDDSLKRGRDEPSGDEHLPWTSLPDFVRAVEERRKRGEKGEREPLRFGQMCQALASIENDKGRIRTTDALSSLFFLALSSSVEELLFAAQLLKGKVTDDDSESVTGKDLGVGGASVVTAIAEVFAMKRETMGKLYRSTGDIGDVAAECKRRQKTISFGGFFPLTTSASRKLTVAGLYKELLRISKLHGKGSITARKQAISSLLRRCETPEEVKFLTRVLTQNIRVGANTITLLTAIARAAALFREVELREGLLSKSVPPSLSKKLQEWAAVARTCYEQHPRLAVVVRALAAGGLEQAVLDCKPSFGTPLAPMLAKVESSILDAILKLSPPSNAAEKKGRDAKKGGNSGGGSDRAEKLCWGFCAEHKYDGQRAQLHLRGADASTYRSFSRHLEPLHERYPELGKSIVEAMTLPPDGDVILDGEVVAVELLDGGSRPKILPFQTLSTRARTADGAEKKLREGGKTVQVCFFLFDVLVWDNVPLLHLPLRRRQQIAESLFNPQNGRFEFATRQEFVFISKRTAIDGSVVPAMPNCSVFDVDDGESLKKCEPFVQEAIDRAVADACEGVILKSLGHWTETEGSSAFDNSFRNIFLPQPSTLAKVDAVSLGCYEAGRRSDGWIKLKKDYLGGMQDTLDLVPIGAWFGNGRKAGWLSPVLLAVYDKETETFQSLCRCMSGFSDAFYQEMTRFYLGKRASELSVKFAKKEPEPSIAEQAEGEGDEEGDSEDENNSEGREELNKTNDEELAAVAVLGERPVREGEAGEGEREEEEEGEGEGEEEGEGEARAWLRSEGPCLSYVVTNELPSVWFRPCEVWELVGADLTISPVHTAAAGKLLETGGKGVSLRFPRFLRKRDDKEVEDATDASTIAEMFMKQASRK